MESTASQIPDEQHSIPVIIDHGATTLLPPGSGIRYGTLSWSTVDRSIRLIENVADSQTAYTLFDCKPEEIKKFGSTFDYQFDIWIRDMHYRLFVGNATSIRDAFAATALATIANRRYSGGAGSATRMTAGAAIARKAGIDTLKKMLRDNGVTVKEAVTRRFMRWILILFIPGLILAFILVGLILAYTSSHLGSH